LRLFDFSFRLRSNKKTKKPKIRRKHAAIGKQRNVSGKRNKSTRFQGTRKKRNKRTHTHDAGTRLFHTHTHTHTFTHRQKLSVGQKNGFYCPHIFLFVFRLA